MTKNATLRLLALVLVLAGLALAAPAQAVGTHSAAHVTRSATQHAAKHKHVAKHANKHAKKDKKTTKKTAKKTAKKHPRVVKHAKKVITPKPTPKPVTKPVSTPVTTTANNDGRVSTPAPVNPAISGLKVMNYQPTHAGWTKLWTDWDPATISSDFARIAALGANAVRISTFPDTFGYPTPSQVMLDRFNQLLTIAAQHGLRVQLTMFDWFTRWNETDLSVQWVRNTFAAFANNPEIAIVEIANEVDPGNAATITWLNVVAATVHQVLPGVPVTASVSGTAGPAGLRALLAAVKPGTFDIADAHFYGAIGTAYQTFTQLVAAAGSLPLYIGEAGYTLAGRPVSQAMAEDDQATFFDGIFRAAAALHIALPAPWTLTDFTDDTMPAGTSMPDFERYFGLYRLDGTARPAADVVHSWFTCGCSDYTPNGTFSTVGSDGAAADWHILVQQGDGTVALDSSVGHTSAGSLALSHTAAPSNYNPSATAVLTDVVTPGEQFTASVWAKGSAATGFNRIGLDWYDANGNWLGQTESAGLPQGTTDWTQLTVTSSPAPSGAAYAVLDLKSAGNTGTVWFDDVTYAVAA